MFLKLTSRWTRPERLAVFVGLGVGVGQAARHAADDEHRQFLGQHPPPVGQLLGELLEVHPADQLHGNEIDPVGLAQVIGLDDVGMDQIGHQLGFADEVLDELLLVGVVLADDLDGDAFDEFARAVLLGFIHDPHAAFEDLAHDLVAELVLDSEEGHARMLVERDLKSSPGASACPAGADPISFP